MMMNVPAVSDYISNMFDQQKEDFRQAYDVDPHTLYLFFGFYKHIVLTKIEEADPESTEGRVLVDIEKALMQYPNLLVEELEKLLAEAHAETLRITDELIKAPSNSDEERKLQKQFIIAIKKEEAILLRIQQLKLTA